jgi:16S rRNA (guanine527-N7)-methyltransferase
MSKEDFVAHRHVSRETLARLEQHAELLGKWNPAINLVSPSSLKEVWSRHFLDSAQLLDLAPAATTHWVDLGAGGGFPGLVVAILAAEERPELKFTLVESDRRKAAFLAHAAHTLGVGAEVLGDRIESIPPLGADVVSARALAPLDQLLSHAAHHMKPGGVAIFPKGARHEEEIRQALEKWRFACEKHRSMTDPEAVVLTVGEIGRV